MRDQQTFIKPSYMPIGSYHININLVVSCGLFSILLSKSHIFRQKNFTEKKRRFFGLKMWILLSKMGDRLHDTTHYSLIWELPIGIYEGFMKVCRLPIPAEKSYRQFKKHKIWKKIEKTALPRFEPQIYQSGILCSPTELQN